MLRSIGKKAAGPGDLVDLLGECHARIRHFSMLASKVSQRATTPDAQVVEACREVERYFGEALPLHVADEEQSLLPRLRGRSPDVDDALAEMHAQHGAHEPELGALLRGLSALHVGAVSEQERAVLEHQARELERALEAHLVHEESRIFPAVRRLLSQAEQAEVMAELRARRSVR